ncbi:MAG TPA: hypothetical protein VK745_25710 [Polyangiaceae bacterium]|nr:hypothetical protein [Polyangiaceae bacterium]
MTDDVIGDATAVVLARCRPAELALTLGNLSVRVDSLHVERRAVSLPDYPGGPRPSCIVRLTGSGCSGLGEHVAFVEAEHDEFARWARAWLQTHRKNAELKVSAALGPDGTPYGRAALEAALIDLGLRQAGLSLHELTGVREAALRFVVSLAAHAEPQLMIQRLRAASYTGDLKLDVAPTWSDATLAELARDPSIAVFDFKGRGDAAFAQRLASLSPHALFEDPPAGFEDRDASSTRISRDASLLNARAVGAARARGEAVNLKAPRMGGPLELLRGLDLAFDPRSTGARVTGYVGGMFEVGVGRSQARQLAALYCSTAPNDLSPNVASDENPSRVRLSPPARVRLDQPGFGSD